MVFDIVHLTKKYQAFQREMLYQAVYVPEGADPPDKSILTDPSVAIYIQNWGKDGDTGFIAVDQQTRCKLGAAWFRLFSEQNKGYGFINKETPELVLAVLPECRGRGIGTLLLKRLLQAAESAYNAISLSVSAENPAKRLYERFGFHMIDKTDDSLTMLKGFG